MYYALIAFVFLILGGLIGYFFQKSRATQGMIEVELLRQENEQLKSREGDWNKVKEESLQAAKAAMFEASQHMSSKLLEDHKRENEAAKKQSQEITEKTTENLNKEFSQIVEKLASLSGQVNKQDSKISTVWQALASPGGAGSYAEIGLENTLKNFGLEKGRDFKTQYSVAGENGRLRPDAVIYLPEGNVMVIDSKSSKYFLEIAAAVENDEKRLLEELKKTMNNHLTSLASKDYKNAVKQDLKLSGGKVINVMYLPNESAMQKVFQADSEFRSKCYKHDIIPADPSALQLLLNIAIHEISRAKQEHNYKVILQEMSKVISSLDVFLRNAESVGRAIRSSAENFSKLSRSVNSRLLPRVRRIIDLGVEPEKNAKIPDSLPDFNVTEHEHVLVEAEEPADGASLNLLDKKAG
ncbi:MAG: hypothetical protein COV36_04990 [Alphaproteobacteria bacterium CG11_big_fil_rev_8_21_14_0_20_44_7]|nr:MAG: hypothetical protein COV36_04990 [Alphaproteobacteria bacterium CG11_big_fil_rev_8_21_14_0_20_44_7]